MAGASRKNEMVYYQIWTSPGQDSLSITVSAQFGNPDLFVSSSRILPTPRYFTWSSRSSGSETLNIAAADPHLCSSCILYVGVLAAASNAHFTITTAVDETLVTLQARVPLRRRPLRDGPLATGCSDPPD
eukprot:4109500-Prymnesium_polylepis.1